VAVASPEIDLGELVGVVGAVFDAPPLSPGAWTATPLTHRIINGVTGGLWRVAGTALVGGAARAWSVILKIIGGVPGDPTSPFAPTDAPGHWNYWRREPLLYASGLLDALPPGLRAPRFFGATLRGDHEVWFWLEDVAAPTAANWPPARFRHAARLLGRWQGGYAAGQLPLPDDAWLSTDWLRDWVPPVPATPDPATDPAAWADAPQIGVPAWLPGAVAALWAERDALLAAVEALPRCLCHRDLWSSNLLGAPDGGPESEIVLIDWSQAGVGVLGEDPANLAFDSAWMYGVPGDALPTLIPLILDEYCAGLRDAGWSGDEGAVRAGFAALGALRFGTLANNVRLLATDPARGATTVANHGGPLSALVAWRLAVVMHALAGLDAARG
jgi:hypothetical protein